MTSYFLPALLQDQILKRMPYLRDLCICVTYNLRANVRLPSIYCAVKGWPQRQERGGCSGAASPMEILFFFLQQGEPGGGMVVRGMSNYLLGGRGRSWLLVAMPAVRALCSSGSGRLRDSRAIEARTSWMLLGEGSSVGRIIVPLNFVTRS